MPQSLSTAEPLITGMHLDRDEFLRRWEGLADLKKAELIEGTVFVPSPVGTRHGHFDQLFQGWLFAYAAHTPGVQGLANATCLMLSSAPQPDASLRILPVAGGATSAQGTLLSGAPELVIEVCGASTDYDYGPKLDLYLRAGVREYITLDTLHGWLVWRSLRDGAYETIAPDADGILKSRVFPGLWLNPADVLKSDGAAILAMIQRGIATPELPPSSSR